MAAIARYLSAIHQHLIAVKSLIDHDLFGRVRDAYRWPPPAVQICAGSYRIRLRPTVATPGSVLEGKDVEPGRAVRTCE